MKIKNYTKSVSRMTRKQLKRVIYGETTSAVATKMRSAALVNRATKEFTSRYL